MQRCRKYEHPFPVIMAGMQQVRQQIEDIINIGVETQDEDMVEMGRHTP